MLKQMSKSERTKLKLKEILIDLCSEKGYHNVTIGDICEQAETYRSTFYRYYDTKDDILREIEHEYIEATRGLTPSFAELRKDTSVEELKRLKEELTEDMKYHQKHRKLCLFLLSPYGDPYFSRKMAESIADRAEKSFNDLHTAYGSNLNYVLHFFASGFISTVYEWLKQKDRTPEEIAEVLLLLITQLRI